ncbi:glycosyltransferase [Psychrobacter sp. NPDC078409]|uniref:glycosyltransferase n=1 Tax=Psychrobacter sp. NPDC078409 TaxID=3390660 RepID=UPI003CFF2D15
MLPLSPEVISYNSKSKNGLPISTLNAIHKMNDINPRVYPPFKGCSIEFDYYNKVIDSAYSQFVLAAGEAEYDGIVFIPRIRTGGTDKLLKSYLKVLSVVMKLKILIVCEDSTKSAWTESFEELADVLYLDESYDNNTPNTYIIASIHYYIIQLAPKFIWGFNSRLAYLLIGTYGASLSQYTDIWVVTFAHWIHEISYREFGMIHDYMTSCNDHIKYIISDNSKFVNKLNKQYNLEVDKLIHIPSPNSLIPIEFEPKVKREKIKILWASGIEWNKGVDTLSTIAEELYTRGVHLHIDVYGTPKNNKGSQLLNSFNNEVKSLNNITYKSAFNSFDGLDPKDYDLFLFTSMIEGMPNILLEAAENQMFIIAPDVGGVSDLIINRETGFLIKDSLDSGEYVNRIDDFINLDEHDFNKIRSNLVNHYNKFYTVENAHGLFKSIIKPAL